MYNAAGRSDAASDVGAASSTGAPGRPHDQGLRAGAIASVLASVWAFCGPPPALAQEAYADVRAASMEKLIGEVPGRSAGPSTQPAGAMRALDILKESAEDFTAALPAPEVTPAERDLLVRHYDAAVSAASSFVNGRAEAIARLD